MTQGWFGGACLVAGTTIGATVLLLIGAVVGYEFYDVIALYSCAWLVMTYSGLMLAEVCAKHPSGHSFLSLVGHYWGGIGKWFTAGVFYLLMFFLLCTYYSVLGQILFGVLIHHSVHLPVALIVCGWVILITLGLRLGKPVLESINSVFVIVMLLSFTFLMMTITPYCNFENLINIVPLKSMWVDAPSSILLIINAFGFHIIVPSVRNLLEDNELKYIFRSIWVGSTIPMALYFAWYIFSISLLPITFVNTVITSVPMDQLSTHVTDLIKEYTQSNLVYALLVSLHFCFVLTSVIGITISIYDLISDVLNKLSVKVNALLISILSTVPSFIYILVDLRGVSAFLFYSGVLVILLNIMMPAVLLLQERNMRPELPTYKLTPTVSIVVVLMAGCLLLPLSIYNL